MADRRRETLTRRRAAPRLSWAWRAAALCLLISLRAPAATEIYSSEGSIEEAEGLLRSGDAARRRLAVGMVEAQLEVAPRRSVPVLLRCLDDGDAGVRARAAFVIGQHQIQEGAQALIERMSDPDAGVRTESARALGKLGALPQALSARAAGALSRVLGDGDFEVRVAALHTLEQLLHARAFVDKDLTQLIAPVQLRVEDENLGVRRGAVAVLWRLGVLLGKTSHGAAQVVVPLLSRLADTASSVRSEALHGLGQLRAMSSVPAVLRLLRDPAPEVRRQAVSALGALEAAAAVPQLVELLERPSEGGRENIVRALGQIARAPSGEGSAALGPLVRCLGREDLRAICREVLAGLGQRAAPELVSRLSVPSLATEEAGAVVGVLGELARALPAEERGRLALALRAELSLGRLPKEVVIDAIGQTGDANSAALLSGYLSDRDVMVRRQALRALRQPGMLDPRGTQALLLATRDSDTEVRRLAVAALAALPRGAALPRLRELLLGDTPEVRAEAARTVASLAAARVRLGPDLVIALAQAVALSRPGEAERHARRAAGEALAQVLTHDPTHNERVIPVLTAPLGRPQAAADPAAHDVVAALGGVLRGRSHKVARDLLISMAESSAGAHTQEAQLATTALDALAAMCDVQTAPALIKITRGTDPLRRARAAAALGCLLRAGAQDRIVGALLSLLASDPDARVRAEAAWALSRLPERPAQRTRVVAGLRQALARNRSAKGDAGERANLVAALALLRESAPEDAELLLDRDPAVRANAVLLIGRAASPGMQARLRGLALGDDDHRVRANAHTVLSGARWLVPLERRRAFLGLHLIDHDHRPRAEQRYRLLMPDGLTRVGTSDLLGTAREELLPEGFCSIDMPDEGPMPR